MEADDWKKIKEVLLEVLELDPGKRAGYLARTDISAFARSEVESLLALESEAEDFMSLPAGDFTRDILTGREPRGGTLAGQRVGDYEIVSELGVGGMGAVYLARRADGKFEQQVAVKMLRREFNTERLRRTFNREKEILASLAHPNIARLLDAGATPDGIPYLVMEYVEGEPIDLYCRGRQLSLHERLKLFNKVCVAVAYAHRSLVVHRDLKPSNILVGVNGEPKLLDFGISKLLGAEVGDTGHITQLGALTPQYASPEQIMGEPVTTATDVYSLGVVLFNLLTENLPYRTHGRTGGELLREITEGAPTPPSEVSLTSLTGHRLKGDLDNIVLKALSKEPERRYQTVEQFSEDIWRFIDGLPVLARPATLSYRASKFYGRNRVTVWAAALILVSLCAGLAAAVWQAGAARRQASIARAEKERAERTSRFMQSLLNYANPHWYDRGNARTDITVREAIDDLAARMDTELADAPEARADLHYTVGEVKRTHGEYKVALHHFRQSLDLYRHLYGEEHTKVARGMFYVSLFATDIEEAEPLLRSGILIMRRTDPDNINLPYMLEYLAFWIMSEEGGGRNDDRLAEAERLMEEAKPLFIRHYGKGHIATINADGALVVLARMRGDAARAESIRAAYLQQLRQAEGVREQSLRRFSQTDEGGYYHIWALFYLAEAKLALGNAHEAEVLFGRALALGQKRWEASDPRLQDLNQYIARARAANASK